MRRVQPYPDRHDAGQLLAAQVRESGVTSDWLVLALPRGGVPVAFEVARALQAPLDVFLVRTLGLSRQPQAPVGAVASGGYECLDDSVIANLGLTPLQVAQIADRETSELRRCEMLYRAGRPPIEVQGRAVCLVDDGSATRFTLQVAIEALRDYGAGQLVVARPVGESDVCREIRREVDALVCPLMPEPFQSVESWYGNFEPTTDTEIQASLATVAEGHEAVFAGYASFGR